MQQGGRGFLEGLQRGILVLMVGGRDFQEELEGGRGMLEVLRVRKRLPRGAAER